MLPQSGEVIRLHVRPARTAADAVSALAPGQARSWPTPELPRTSEECSSRSRARAFSRAGSDGEISFRAEE